MALPSSGPLSIGQIRTELGSSSGSLRTLSSLAGKSTPDAISEFYGYSACPAAGTYYSQYCSGYDLYYTYHNGSCGYYSSLYESNSTTCGYVAPTNCTIWYAPYTSYFSFVGCDGISYYEFFEANQSLCARSTSGMINSGNECFNTPY